MSVAFERRSRATPEAAWALCARPDRWHEWAPHVRGAWGLGSPEVRAGRVGIVRLLGAVPVLVEIRSVVPGRAWTWRVGVMELTHRVDPEPDGGCTVGIDLRAPGPLEGALARTYGRVIGWALGRLADRADRVSPRPARAR